MWRTFRLFKPARLKVEDFCSGRTCQPDDGFLRDCNLGQGTDAAEIALAVRRAVAAVGMVDSLFIRCDDSYPGTLEVLPLWDSMDWCIFLAELELELGRPVRWHPADMLQNIPVTVSDLISHIQRLLGERGSSEPG